MVLLFVKVKVAHRIILEKMRLNNYYILKIYDESFLILSVHEQTIMGLTEFEI